MSQGSSPGIVKGSFTALLENFLSSSPGRGKADSAGASPSLGRAGAGGPRARQLQRRHRRQDRQGGARPCVQLPQPDLQRKLQQREIVLHLY